MRGEADKRARCAKNFAKKTEMKVCKIGRGILPIKHTKTPNSTPERHPLQP